MDIRVFKKLDDDVYIDRIHTENWSQGDLLLMGNYGEPEVDVGGEFTGTGDQAGITFELPTKLYGIKTGSHFIYSFDKRDYADAEDRAIIWKTVMVSRITAALTALRLYDDEFTGEEVTTI